MVIPDPDPESSIIKDFLDPRLHGDDKDWVVITYPVSGTGRLDTESCIFNRFWTPAFFVIPAKAGIYEASENTGFPRARE